MSPFWLALAQSWRLVISPKWVMRWLRKLFHLRFTAHCEYVLGTSLEVQAIAKSRAQYRLVWQAALQRIDELEDIFSVYRSDSEFMQWQNTRDVPVPVSPELAHVLSQAEYFRVASNNAFCPVADALYAAWREGEAVDENSLGGPLWTVDLHCGTATRHTHLPATLNAIAKGYIIDQAASAALKQGAIELMVNIGGDLSHLGTESIVVKVTNPADDAENAEALQKVRISNESMATSGGYRRGHTHEGKWISHIFNVQTMEPAEAHASVSVIAPTAMQADALATVCGVLPPSEALLFANKMNDVGVLIVGAQGGITSNNVWDRHIID